MDEQQDNDHQVGNVPEPTRAGPAAPTSSPDGEMPMLAGSAASRLTQQILSRLGSPFAVPSASPVRPGALWRQVTRRLGVAPEEKSRAGIPRSLSPLAPVQTQQARSAQDPFGLEPRELVWRTAQSQAAQKDDVSAEERIARATRPAVRTASPFLVPAQTPPASVQPTPAQVTPSVIPASPTIVLTPTERPGIDVGQVPVQAQSANVAPSAVPTPTQVKQTPNAEAAPVTLSSQTPPARVVAVEYVQGPAALPVQPLVSHVPLVEEPSYYTPRNFADSLYRDLIPTTDMISRMTRPSWEDMPLPERRSAPTSNVEAPAPSASDIPAPIDTLVAASADEQPVLQPAPAQQTAQAERALPTVVQSLASTVEEAPRLEMPLAATPTTSAQSQAVQREPVRTVEETLEQAHRSPVRQLFDRVVNTLPLPETVRRFVTGEPAPVMRQAPPAATEQQQPLAAPMPQPAPMPLAAPLDAQRQVAPTIERVVLSQAPDTATPLQAVTIAPQSVTSEIPAQPSAQPEMPLPIAPQSPSATSLSAPRAASQQQAPAVVSSPSPAPQATVSFGRTSFDRVPAPAASIPPALDMPVRETTPSPTPQVPVQQTEARLPRPQSRVTQPELPASPFGPFQAFQPVQPPQNDIRTAQPVEAQQIPPVEPLGPFQPFQPEQNSVATSVPAQVSDTSVQESVFATISVQPSPVDTPVALVAEPRLAEALAPAQSAPAEDTTSRTDPTPVVARPTEAAPDGAADAPSSVAVQATQSEPTSSAPAVREATTERNNDPRGFLGSLFDRLFGRGGRDAERETGQEQPGAPALEMPWVRQDRAPRTQQDAASTPSEVGLPATRIAQPVTQLSPPVQTPSPSSAPTVAVPTPSPSTSQEAPTTVSTPTVDVQPQVHIDTSASPVQSQIVPTPVPAESTTLPVSSSVSPVQLTGSATSPSTSKSEATSPFASAQEYVETQLDASNEVPSDAPDLARVLPLSSSIVAPQPLDMPHAASQQVERQLYEEQENLLQSALLPDQAIAASSVRLASPVAPPPEAAVPINIPQAEAMPAQQVESAFVTSAEPVQSESSQIEPIQAQPAPIAADAPQAWTLMPDMAEGLVRSHAPISATEPMETAAQSDLLERILGSFGHKVGRSESDSPDLSRAVPAPPTGVGTGLPFALPTGSEQASSTVAQPFYSSGVPPQSTMENAVSTPQYTPASSHATGTPAPIGTPTTPMLGRPQFMPEGLRDIRTTSNLPAMADSFARPIAPETSSAVAAPDPVSMPPRYITNVTPATYLAEATVAGAQPGGSPMGTVMHPASYMSPSLANYGWQGDDTAPVTPSVMLPLSEMSPTAESYVQSDATSSEQSQAQPQYEQAAELPQQAPWMEALQALYGQKTDENMPLAIPYGAFALPSESRTSPVAWQAPLYGQTGIESSQGRPASQGFSSLPMPTPSVPTAQSVSDPQSFSQPQSYSSNSSWSTDGASDSGSYSSWSADNSSDADSSEAGAWADVVASAVSGASDGAPALALASEERGSSAPQAPAEPSNTQDGGKGASADLDELAESVLDIIRHRIVIERERNFG